ncbi:MAG: NAD(P)/FAD-dependent oxidoreductase, partial [Cryobacterium sp.]|nr:NAD(P)/FAD-dependent oxidoreductase [Cryobacterium sp.]
MTNQRQPLPGTLIVGASQAGVQVAVTMRELGYTDPITIVGAENQLPYQLPPLSKAFLSGTADEESLELRTAAFYADKGIRLVLGERVREIRFDGTAGEAVTDAGTALSFDRLALTVGAAPRRLALPGAQLGGVGYLRNMADARRLQADLATAESVAVIGGGFIGLEAAAAARSFGKKVTVFETADRLIARAVAPEMSEFYRAAHERRGTTVRLGVSVTGLVGRVGRGPGVGVEGGVFVAAE